MENPTKSFYRIIAHNNKRAWKNNGIGILTPEELERAYKYFNGRCAYSGIKIDDDNSFSLEHIIPIISGGHSIAFNCVPVISRYNSSKSGYHLLDWWGNQNDGKGNTIYNPYRLLKIINYVLKTLKSYEDNKDYLQIDNKIDEYLSKIENLLYSNIQSVDTRDNNKKLSIIEVMINVNLKPLEEEHELYNKMGGIKIDLGVFLAEAIDFIRQDIKDDDLIEYINELFYSIGDIEVENRIVYSRNDKRIETNRRLIEWLKNNHIENVFGIAGYSDLEFLSSQENLEEYLNNKKMQILKLVGINEEYFNLLLNKVPNILTVPSLKEDIKRLVVKFSIDNTKNENGISELYRYIVKKPDLLFSSEIIQKLSEFSDVIKIDKKVLKRGLPLGMMLDNLEAILYIIDKANLKIPTVVKHRIIKKFFDNSNGNSIRLAYENLKRRVKNANPGFSKEQIENEAAKWIICISEKYDTSKIFKERCIGKTSKLYRTISFDEDGYMVGVNKNAYYVPQIVEMANLDIPKEAEAILIENMFTSRNVRKGVNINFVLDYLKIKLRELKPQLSEEKIAQEAARWLIFISENAYIMLDILYNPEKRDEYIIKTVNLYKNMEFDERGNYINVKLDGFPDDKIGIDYMDLVNRFFRSKGSMFYIAGRPVKKSVIYDKIGRELENCKNKKMVKEVCLKTLKIMSRETSRKRRGRNRGSNEH